MLRLYHHDVHREDFDGDVRFRLTFGENPERGKLAAELFAQGHYKPIAELDLPDSADALNDFYRLTQNIDSSWGQELKGGVRLIVPATERRLVEHLGKRSSMMGDIIEVAEQAGDGWRPIKRYVVDQFGFADVPMEGADA